MNHFYVYIHAKPDGTPFYVGKGCNGRSRNFSNRGNQFHRRVVAKYGAEQIKVFVFPCDTEAQAFSDERRWIAQLRADGCELTNCGDGGDGGSSGCKRSPATIAKMSKSQAGHECSAEARRKMSEAKKGKPGHKLSPNARTKISAALRGEGNGGSRLSEELVCAIRAEYATGLTSTAQLGKRYGISRSHAWMIVSNKLWKCVQPNTFHPSRSDRKTCGEKNKMSKLNDDTVRFIRASTEATGKLASLLKIHRTTITKVRSGMSWKHVDG